MAGPLIPYINAPEIPLGFLAQIPLLGDMIDPAHPPSIKPFGTLVALGVYAGSMLTMRRAEERKFDTKQMNDFIFWAVAAGFVISHMLDAIFYHPDTVARDPWYLLRIWDGLSSYGGFIGAVVGVLAWRALNKVSILEYVDVTVSCFPLAWVFGRTGCSVVHDHPGMLSNAWYAVQYPAHTLQAGYAGRIDLGLVEMVLTIPLAAACFVLWARKPLRPAGFYIALTLTYYAPVRFLLDFMRIGPGELHGSDPRYGGLTPAQWACFLAFGVGLYFLKRVWGKPYVRLAPPAPERDEDGDIVADGDDDEDDEPRPRPRKKKKARRKKKRPVDEAPDDDEGDEAEPPKPSKARKKKTRRKKKKAPVED